MFSVSRQVDYAVQFLLELSTLPTHEHLSVKQFSLRRKLSFLFLQKIVGRLKQAGLISSIKGVNGGYALLHSPQSITLLQIMEAIEGKFATVSCFSNESECPALDVCLSRRVFKHIQIDMVEIMKKYTLADMAQL